MSSRCESCEVVSFEFQPCWSQPLPSPLLLLLPAAEINGALEAIGEISHAENMEYSSDAQSSHTGPIDWSGCVFEGGGGAGVYIGTSDIDTVALLVGWPKLTLFWEVEERVFLQKFSSPRSVFLIFFIPSEVSLSGRVFSLPTISRVSTSPSPLIISPLRTALSPTASPLSCLRRPVVCAFSPLCLSYLCSPFGQPFAACPPHSHPAGCLVLRRHRTEFLIHFSVSKQPRAVWLQLLSSRDTDWETHCVKTTLSEEES